MSGTTRRAARREEELPSMVTTAPYGAWPSPIDARTVAAHDGRPAFVGVVGDEVWWTEPRPAEGGRRALVRRRPDGTEEAVLPAPWNVRSRVLEYGGQPWAGTAHRARTAGRLQRLRRPAAVRLRHRTAARPRARSPRCPPSAAGCAGSTRCCARSWGRCGASWRSSPATGPPTSAGCSPPCRSTAPRPKTAAAVRELSDDRHRFVTGPRLSPDGRRAAWIAWDHPQMPWDGTLVMLADITDEGEFEDIRPLVGDLGPTSPGRRRDRGVRRADRVGRRRLAALRLRPQRLVGAAAHRPRGGGRRRGGEPRPVPRPPGGVRRPAVERRAALVPAAGQRHPRSHPRPRRHHPGHPRPGHR